MDTARCVVYLKRWWWLAALGSAAALGAFAAMAHFQVNEKVPSYRASTTLITYLSADPPTFGAADPQWDLDRLMATYVEIIVSDEVAGVAQHALSLDDDSPSEPPRVTASIIGETQLIRIEGTAPTRQQAEALLGGVLIEMNRARETHRLPGRTTIYEFPRATRVDPDETPAALAITLVVLAGAVGAAAMAFAFEYLSDRIRDAADAGRATGLAVLATIPPHGSRGGALPAGAPKERYRMLRTAVNGTDAGAAARVVLFTAPMPGCGTSVVAANFARAHGEMGRRVALIDANLRSPSLQNLFRIPRGRGLADLLREGLSVEAVARRVDSGVTLIEAGSGPIEHPAELLDSPRFDRLLFDLRARFDLVVLDSPPALPIEDASVLAARCDVTIVVVGMDRTTRGDAAAAVEVFRRSSATLLGAVLTGDVTAPRARFGAVPAVRDTTLRKVA
jgi:capsular exopolysaccharide synthesis family protein